MEYKLKQPVYSQTSGCGGPGDCATKQIMHNSKIQNKINNLSGGSSERGPVVPNVVGATEQQNNLFAKVSKLSVDMQENSKYDGEVGMAPKKGGARRKVTKKRRCCKICGRRHRVKVCSNICKTKCLPSGKSKKNRRKTKRRNKSKRRKTRVKKGRGGDDDDELDKYPFRDGRKWKKKPREKEPIEVDMNFAPWEPGFKKPNYQEFDSKTWLDPDNRVISRPYGSRSWPTRENVKLMKAYDKVVESIKKKEAEKANAADEKGRL